MAEVDLYNFSNWREAEIEIDHYGKAPKKYGEDAYRFGGSLTLGKLMPRRGWELIKEAKNYVYLKPNTVPPYHFKIKIPSKEQAYEIAHACYEAGESWMGQIGEWPAWYIHKEPGNRFEHFVEGDVHRHVPTSEPRSWLQIGEFGVWRLQMEKFAGEFSYHESVKLWKGGPEPLSLFNSPTVVSSLSGERKEKPESNFFLNRVETFLEGQEITIEQTFYERNPAARNKCIEHFGLSCQVCGLSFGNVYGEIGTGFIHVHHINPVSAKGGEYEVNPVTDLVPLCPNCHAMAHRRTPPYSIEELRSIYFRARK